MKNKIKRFVGCCCITASMVSVASLTTYAAPLPGEPSWDYIAEKYPDGITVKQASDEGITQFLLDYFDGYEEYKNSR